MAHRAGIPNPLISNSLAKWGLIIGIAFCFSPLIFSGSQETGKRTELAKQPTIKTMEVTLQEKEWTDWIYLQPGDKWQIDAPGWVEYQFWDGTKRYVADKNTRWLGKVNSGTFRLRGVAGIAKFTVERYYN